MSSLIKYLLSFFIMIIMAGLTSPALSQDSGSTGAFSRLGFGPRGIAMGNALTAVASEGVFSYYNPALAAYAPSANQIDIATAAMIFDRSLNIANGTFRLPPSGGLSISVLNANVTGIDGRTVDGYHTGRLSTHEYQFAITMGQQLSEKLSAGIGIKYYLSNLHPSVEAAKTVALDLGLLYKLTKHLQAGVVAQDLLASYRWNSSSLYGDELSSRIDDFPRRIRLGISYHISSELLLSMDCEHSIYENTSQNSIRIGSRFHLHKLVTLRGGWQFKGVGSSEFDNHFSSGFSLKLPFDLLKTSIDYAFLQEPNNISYMHTFGLQILL